MKKKILTVLGARPQFIKASAVSQQMLLSSDLEEVIVHTGQHFDANMSDVFFQELNIQKPGYQLDIHGGTHGAMTGKMLEKVESVILTERPDAVLVYGDTNSTLAGALASIKLHIPVAHVEAGLRSFNMAMPEEINRILTDRISTWLFAPTEAAVSHLQQEGFSSDKIIMVGDVMYDVAQTHGRKLSAIGGKLDELGLSPRDFVLATIHRAENTDDIERMMVIVESLVLLSQKTTIVWPLHPRTLSVLTELGVMERVSKSISLIDPLSYLEMVQLEKFASMIITDSGGVQKEAYFHRVPCVTLRHETEWTELIDNGWNRLAPPTDTSSLIQIFDNARSSVGENVELYGGGNAAAKVVENLEKAVFS